MAEEDGKRGRKSKRRYEDSEAGSSGSSSDDSRGSSKSEEIRRRKPRKRRRERESSSSSGSSSGEDSDGGERKRSRSRRHKKEDRRHRSSKEKSKEKRRKEKKKEEKKKRKKKEKADRQKKGPVTASWGKYGLIKEIDMWNKRPEFSAWLAEVKKVNLETLPNWEERQMFKEYMEDYNTATLPSKKYYNIDKYHQEKLVKNFKKGALYRSMVEMERTEFNDEEQRRQELKMLREHEKEAHIKELKHSMDTGMAQAMREQAQLREEMQYQYRLGNVEAANAIQRRLEPDAI